MLTWNGGRLDVKRWLQGIEHRKHIKKMRRKDCILKKWRERRKKTIIK